MIIAKLTKSKTNWQNRKHNKNKDKKRSSIDKTCSYSYLHFSMENWPCLLTHFCVSFNTHYYHSIIYNVLTKSTDPRTTDRNTHPEEVVDASLWKSLGLVVKHQTPVAAGSPTEYVRFFCSRQFCWKVFGGF